jgi:cell wall-associated NlpC family hydrolase
MTGAALSGVAAVILGLVIACATAAASLLGGGPQSACAIPPSNPRPAIIRPTGGWPPVGRWNHEQVANAGIIAAVGAQQRVPVAGQLIAIATAMQESSLRNLPGGDRDSIGLFQQRPSQGWGSPQQLRDPVYAARAFYQRLLDVPGWQTMPLTDATQAVQLSAHPTAYAKWTNDARQLLDAVGSALPRANPEDREHCPSNCPGAASSTLVSKPRRSSAPTVECLGGVGWMLPHGAVGAMLRAALDQVGDPYVYAAAGPDAFDCSGLVVYAWTQAGYRLAVRTAEQMRRVSTPIPDGQERPGDLVFSEFDTPRVPDGAGHVAIVVHRGLVVEAPRTGLDVRLRSYSSDDPTLRFGRLPTRALRPISPARTDASPRATTGLAH